MKITRISTQQADPNRVNIFVDEKYRFSLDIFQVGELGIRVGSEYSETEISALEQESVFGKAYTRALEYTMLRPHSIKEMRDYLWRKTLTTKIRSKKTGQIVPKQGISKDIATRVLERLIQKGYVDDEKFARFWVEHRQQRKGISLKKLTAELQSKGVSADNIAVALTASERNDQEEVKKIIEKKRMSYSDPRKLTAYLMRQGFQYDVIKAAIEDDEDSV